MLSGEGDVDSLSADEKSDGEGRNDRMSSSSSSTSVTSSTDTQEVRECVLTHTDASHKKKLWLKFQPAGEQAAKTDLGQLISVSVKLLPCL